ncbi:hypothetical protein SDC9_176926 [bioreactor metagenome]|uniref:Uncharacterized protein n=1 Tax=bioreactor metagenome TaxID=1076179 RepID=A0A645H0S5_9ZZZZ
MVQQQMLCQSKCILAIPPALGQLHHGYHQIGILYIQVQNLVVCCQGLFVLSQLGMGTGFDQKKLKMGRKCLEGLFSKRRYLVRIHLQQGQQVIVTVVAVPRSQLSCFLIQGQGCCTVSLRKEQGSLLGSILCACAGARSQEERCQHHADKGAHHQFSNTVFSISRTCAR